MYTIDRWNKVNYLRNNLYLNEYVIEAEVPLGYNT